MAQRYFELIQQPYGITKGRNVELRNSQLNKGNTEMFNRIGPIRFVSEFYRRHFGSVRSRHFVHVR